MDQEKQTAPGLLIFTDLDGTLLDHDTYRFDRAQSALEEIAARKIPLILNTSKTLAEVLEIRRSLNNSDPFIAENGSIVAVPEGYFPFEPGAGYAKVEQAPGILAQCLGGERTQILEILHHLRQDHGFAFTGFNDLTINELSQITGLPQDRAHLARQRLSTEPVVWEGSKIQLEIFLAHLADNHLAAVQGGRFLSISRPFDKKDGVAVLLDLYERVNKGVPVKIGLGDSPNDQGMLEMMDIAVVIKSKNSNQIHLDCPGRVIRTKRPGPEGWQEAMDHILRR